MKRIMQVFREEKVIRLPRKTWEKIDRECEQQTSIKNTPLPILVPHDPLKYPLKKQQEVINPR
jgi:hypothetical protein